MSVNVSGEAACGPGGGGLFGKSGIEYERPVRSGEGVGCCASALTFTQRRRIVNKTSRLKSNISPAIKPQSGTKSTNTRTSKKPVKQKLQTANTLQIDVEAALAWLEENSSKKILEEMLPRYGINAKKAFGVSVGNIQKLAKIVGRNHEFALALWETGWYEARMLASFVDDPARVTPAQMDRWCRDFDNWGICDTVCFHLFDRSPHAYRKVEQWAGRRDEFVKRGAFALMACLALHDKQASHDRFAKWFPLIEEGATDERNFVKKGVSWALRGVATRSPELKSAAIELAERLATSPERAARWVGKDVLRQLKRK
jgi:3-methyladenine DNA glycosylase AlkD